MYLSVQLRHSPPSKRLKNVSTSCTLACTSSTFADQGASRVSRRARGAGTGPVFAAAWKPLETVRTGNSHPYKVISGIAHWQCYQGTFEMTLS